MRNSESQESGSETQVVATLAAAVQKHKAATVPASQGKRSGKRQKMTKASIVSVPSIMPAAWKKDLGPLSPLSRSPRPAARTARPRNEAQVQTKEKSSKV